MFDKIQVALTWFFLQKLNVKEELKKRLFKLNSIYQKSRTCNRSNEGMLVAFNLY